MRRLRAALLLATALGGCRQVLRLDEREVGATEVTAENYVAAVARAFCEELEPCCTKHGYGFRGDACERVVAGFTQATVANARSVGIPFDAVAASACLQATLDLVRACEPSEAQSDNREAACGRVYAGTKALGEPCQFDLECAFGPGEQPACSDGGDDGVSRCAVFRRGVEGDPCDGSDPLLDIECEREDGLRCDGEQGRCVALTGAGGPCYSEFDCTDDLYCRLGACTPRGALGAECTPGFVSCGPSACIAGPCAPGLLCDVVSRTCVAAKPLGAECSDDPECGEGQCLDGRCEPEDVLLGVELCGAPRR